MQCQSEMSASVPGSGVSDAPRHQRMPDSSLGAGLPATTERDLCYAPIITPFGFGFNPFMARTSRDSHQGSRSLTGHTGRRARGPTYGTAWGRCEGFPPALAPERSAGASAGEHPVLGNTNEILRSLTCPTAGAGRSLRMTCVNYQPAHSDVASFCAYEYRLQAVWPFSG
jgi:hypothetical protein